MRWGWASAKARGEEVGGSSAVAAGWSALLEQLQVGQETVLLPQRGQTTEVESPGPEADSCEARKLSRLGESSHHTGGQGIDHAELGSGKRQEGSRTLRSLRFSARTSAGRSRSRNVSAS